MARTNAPGLVDWERLGPVVRQALLDYYRTHGQNGALQVVCNSYAGHGLTKSRLAQYLGRDATWPPQRDAALAVFAGRTPAPARPSPPPVVTPPPDPIQQAEERRARLREYREERELLTAVAGEKSLRSFLEKLAEGTVDRVPPPKPYKAPKASSSTSQESIVMQWSDWHAYEVVKAERTRGFNHYNAEVFGQRVKALVDAHTSIKRRMERGKGWRFNRLALALNGDFVSGTIHEAERHSDAPHIVMAVYGCASVLAHAIRDVAAEYEVVDCYGTTGNHGRFPDAKRMQQKDALRSWDALIYLLAREMLRDVPNVTFTIPDAYSVAFDVEGWTFLQTHGHDIKSWNSIPHYGINRYVGNINALEASRGQTVAYYLFGHFHTASSLEHASGESFINGSLIGGTEYGINALGKSGPPVQWMLGVHPEHGVTHRWPLSGKADAAAEGYAAMPWHEAA